MPQVFAQKQVDAKARGFVTKALNGDDEEAESAWSCIVDQKVTFTAPKKGDLEP